MDGCYSAPQFMFLSQPLNSHFEIQRFLKWVPSQTTLLGPVLNCVLHWCHLVRVMWLMLHQILSCSSLPVRHLTVCQGSQHCFSFKWCSRKKHSKQAGKTKYYANLYSWNPGSCLSKLLWSVNIHHWLTSSSVLRGVVFSGACIRSLSVHHAVVHPCNNNNTHYWDNLHWLKVRIIYQEFYTLHFIYW